MKSYYHVSSHGLEKNDIFKNREDFIAGMNDVAICLIGCPISILAFCLMSNHFHFILYGTYEECRIFVQEYKRKCAMRMRRSAGEVKGLKGVQVQIDEIDSMEYLRNAIAYVLRNPLAAGIFLMPYHYPWSSASLYFSNHAVMGGELLCAMSERKRNRILKSCLSVPDNYRIDAQGVILPGCYVDVQAVERIFGHPSRLMHFLARKIESDIELHMGIADKVIMTDQDILTQLPVLIREHFSKDCLEQLSVEQRIKLCPLLKRNFGAGAKQIARLTRLGVDVVAKLV